MLVKEARKYESFVAFSLEMTAGLIMWVTFVLGICMCQILILCRVPFFKKKILSESAGNLPFDFTFKLDILK